MKNLRRLACKFDLDQSERKSTQVHASPGQTKLQVDPSLHLASTCLSIWPGFYSGSRVTLPPCKQGLKFLLKVTAALDQRKQKRTEYS